ncbi:hypothetical protein [Streptomyces sp. NPDC005989]|uniref:hypothetical protein n=1 Tax=Streptomyces sp. NPDC005989 TaxID=3156727 RepID=UPI0033EE8AF7
MDARAVDDGATGDQELKIAAARQGPTRVPAPDPHGDPAARAPADTIHASREAPADPLTAAQLPPGALCLAIGHTDATRSTVDTACRARRTGAEVIGLTSYAQSPQSGTCTHTRRRGQDLVFGLETTASRIAHLVTVDALTQTLLTLRAAAAGQALRLSADVTADHTYRSGGQVWVTHVPNALHMRLVIGVLKRIFDARCDVRLAPEGCEPMDCDSFRRRVRLLLTCYGNYSVA